MAIYYPLENVIVTGGWGNSPAYYAQFGQLGHNAIDMAAAIGTPVYATDAGVVVAEGWGKYDNWMGEIAGLFVRLKHWWGYSAYAHLSETLVDIGQNVQANQLIAKSGATGVGTGPHLHFETYPLYPNFGNGFAGRVNPHTFGLLPFPTRPGKPKPPPKPKDPFEMAKPITVRNERNKKQIIEANERTSLRFRDEHQKDKTDRTIARGPGRVVGLVVNVTLEGGTPGKRVNLELTREIGEGKSAVRLGRSRDVFDTNGMFSKQIVFTGALSKDQLVRAYVQTELGCDKVEVTSFFADGVMI